MSGSARAVVVATGPRTRLGGIARLTGEVVRRPTPLRLDLDRAVRVIALCAVAAGVVFFLATLWLGMTAGDGFLFAIGVIVALVPEGLLPTLTLSLAISANRMAHRGALVRHLESVETLGATTVDLLGQDGHDDDESDDGSAAWTPTRRIVATRSGWAPGGTLLFEDERPLDEETLDQMDALFRAAALCGDARLEPKDGWWRCVGDPTEGALLAFARKAGIHRDDAERFTPRIKEFPFGSDRRRMTTIHRQPDAGAIGYTKGSPEAVLEVCASVRVDGTYPSARRRAIRRGALGRGGPCRARSACARLRSRDVRSIRPVGGARGRARPGAARPGGDGRPGAPGGARGRRSLHWRGDPRDHGYRGPSLYRGLGRCLCGAARSGRAARRTASGRGDGARGAPR